MRGQMNGCVVKQNCNAVSGSDTRSLECRGKASDLLDRKSVV
jgi:hypothetical protein